MVDGWATKWDFTRDQLHKLKPIVEKLTEFFHSVATFYHCVPLLACEIRCGDAASEIADYQNANSRAPAVGDIIEIYRAAELQKRFIWNSRYSYLT